MKIKLLLLFILSLLLPFIAYPQQEDKNAIVFGEHARRLNTEEKNVIRVFIDKNGFYYPEREIKDGELIASNGELKTWYKNHGDTLDLLCRMNNIDVSLPQQEKIERLNDSICRQLIRKINSKRTAFPEVCLLIHGYRKRAYSGKDIFTTSSVSDNKVVESTLSKTAANCLFVEIYWDSKYIAPRQSVKNRSFLLFQQQASSTANVVGLSLRKLVTPLEYPKINILTHSLGARVGAELLFNANQLQDETIIKTPPQKINLCMVAPAIGSDLFTNYYNRGGSQLKSPCNDNYRISVVYNHNDIILLKKYDIFIFSLLRSSATEYGNTSLGCDYKNDIGNLKQLFSTTFSCSASPECFDFSVKKIKRGKSHKVTRYLQNKNSSQITTFFFS